MWPSRSAVVTLYIVHTIQSLGPFSAAVVLLLRAVWGLPPPAAAAPHTTLSILPFLAGGLVLVSSAHFSATLIGQPLRLCYVGHLSGGLEAVHATCTCTAICVVIDLPSYH